MPDETFTNIDELVNHLQRMSDGILSNRAVLERFANEAIETTKGNVLKGINSKWNQTGQLAWAIEADGGGVRFNKRTLLLGVGELDHMNQVKRKAMRATFLLRLLQLKEGNKRRTRQEVFVQLRFKAEPQLPEWLIAEFGRGQSNHIPKQFMVNYTQRAGKEYMVGPSARQGGGLRKPIFFQASRKRATEFMQNPRKHTDIKAGMIFRKGLQNSKSQIYEIMGKGIESSLRDFASKNGGMVK